MGNIETQEVFMNKNQKHIHWPKLHIFCNFSRYFICVGVLVKSTFCHQHFIINFYHQCFVYKDWFMSSILVVLSAGKRGSKVVGVIYVNNQWITCTVWNLNGVRQLKCTLNWLILCTKWCSYRSIHCHRRSCWTLWIITTTVSFWVNTHGPNKYSYQHVFSWCYNWIYHFYVKMF